MAEELETPEPEITAPPEPDVAPPPAPEPKKPDSDWRLVELGQTRRQLEERSAELQRLQDENRRLAELAQAAARAPVPTPEPAAPAAPPADADIERRVQERVEQTILNDRARQLDAALKADFAEDYQTILGNFGNVQNSMRLMFDDILATGEGAFVAATIGKDPARIQQLRDMPAAQRRMALLKISLDKPKASGEPAKAEPARPSAAPPPPSPAPAGGGPGLPSGSIDLYDQRLDFNSYRASGDVNKEFEADNRWFAERLRQKRNSVGRAWSLPQNK